MPIERFPWRRRSQTTRANAADPGVDDAHSLEARYSNYFQIGYNAHEFLLDFGLLYKDLTQARFHTRIITSPAYAKELCRTLGDSIEQYENSYGPIPGSDDDTVG